MRNRQVNDSQEQTDNETDNHDDRQTDRQTSRTRGHAQRPLQELVLLEHLLLLLLLLGGGAGLALARREHGPHLALARGPGKLALPGELEAGPLGPGVGYRVAGQGAVTLHAAELGTLS